MQDSWAHCSYVSPYWLVGLKCARTGEQPRAETILGNLGWLSSCPIDNTVIAKSHKDYDGKFSTGWGFFFPNNHKIKTIQIKNIPYISQVMFISSLYQGLKETPRYHTDFKSKSLTYLHSALLAWGISFKCFMEDFVLLVVPVTNYEAFVPHSKLLRKRPFIAPL